MATRRITLTANDIRACVPDITVDPASLHFHARRINGRRQLVAEPDTPFLNDGDLRHFISVAYECDPEHVDFVMGSKGIRADISAPMHKPAPMTPSDAA